MGLAQLQLTNVEVRTQVILWYHQMVTSNPKGNAVR